MTGEEAIRIVALHAIASAAEGVGEDGWENYPEIGEHDWESVVDLIGEIAPFPSAEEYREAYDLLSGRADPLPNGNAFTAPADRPLADNEYLGDGHAYDANLAPYKRQVLQESENTASDERSRSGQ